MRVSRIGSPNVSPHQSKNVVSEQNAKRSAIETGSRSKPRLYPVFALKLPYNQKALLQMDSISGNAFY